MRFFWFIVLAALAFGLGATGGATWTLTKSGLASLRGVCEVTRVAERSGALSKEQVGDVVRRVAARSGSGVEIGQLMKELEAGCPNLK